MKKHTNGAVVPSVVLAPPGPRLRERSWGFAGPSVTLFEVKSVLVLGPCVRRRMRCIASEAIDQ